MLRPYRPAWRSWSSASRRRSSSRAELPCLTFGMHAGGPTQLASLRSLTDHDPSYRPRCVSARGNRPRPAAQAGRGSVYHSLQQPRRSHLPIGIVIRSDCAGPQVDLDIKAPRCRVGITPAAAVLKRGDAHPGYPGVARLADEERRAFEFLAREDVVAGEGVLDPGLNPSLQGGSGHSRRPN